MVEFGPEPERGGHCVNLPPLISLSAIAPFPWVLLSIPGRE